MSLITADEAAAILDITSSSFRSARYRKAGFPQPVARGGDESVLAPLWEEAEVRAWGEKHPRRTRPGQAKKPRGTTVRQSDEWSNRLLVEMNASRARRGLFQLDRLP